MIRYKAAKAGVEVGAVSPRYTSQTCSRCLHLGIRPSQSKFQCRDCGYQINADLNGAKSIANKQSRSCFSQARDFMKPNRRPNINHLARRMARLRSSQSRQLTFLFALTLLVTTIIAGTQQKKSSFADLTKLFAEWRAFQRPDLSDGVPDYSARAMSAQHRELPAFQRRLADIAISGWPTREQVDWHIVRAEMK